MQGYYKMPEETKTALKDGWLCTGDLGYVDEERFIYLTGTKEEPDHYKEWRKCLTGRTGE